MEISEIFLQNLRTFFERYKAAGGTQSSLANSIGVKQGQISVWLRGGYLPGAENLPALAHGLGVSIEDFYRENAEGKNGEPSNVPELLLRRIERAYADPKQRRRLENALKIIEMGDEDDDESEAEESSKKRKS